MTYLLCETHHKNIMQEVNIAKQDAHIYLQK